MRVIAGSAGGLRLATPKAELRPTMDRVRGAVFSSLGDAVPGARVLDLFAGSGAMGIEALSRGATEAVFVDNNPACTSCVKANLRHTGLEGSVQTMEAMKFLELYAVEPFDLIFADPPYANKPDDPDLAEILLASPTLSAALSPTGTLVLERRAKRKYSPAPDSLLLLRCRRYGKSELSCYTHA